jgi:hypothetical protein
VGLLQRAWPLVVDASASISTESARSRKQGVRIGLACVPLRLVPTGELDKRRISKKIPKGTPGS